jgi:hypothetical protein
MQTAWSLVPSFSELLDDHVCCSRRRKPQKVPVLLPILKPSFRPENGERALFFIPPRANPIL